MHNLSPTKISNPFTPQNENINDGGNFGSGGNGDINDFKLTQNDDFPE
jgi:hypothetical protein